MDHHEFVSLRRSGNVGIDRSIAMGLVDHLPKRYQAATHFWSWVWGLSNLGFIIGAFFTMGVSLLGLLFISPVISSSIKKSAVDFVLEYAAESEEFFNMLQTNNFLVVRQ